MNPTAASTDRPLALLCAVAAEATRLHVDLRGARPLRFGGKDALAGTLDDRPVILLPTGMGKANAAHGATALLASQDVAGVIGFGIAGAYPERGVGVGDVVVASAAVYAEEGAESPNGWLSTEEIGIPLLARGGCVRFNRFDVDATALTAAEEALAAAGIVARSGVAVCVSASTGTEARAAELARRHDGLFETMESAALAHVCGWMEVPYVEVRAISNLVEDRDPSRWRFTEAAQAAQAAVRVVARAWRPA